MQPDQLKVVGKALWGRGWQTRLAEALGIDGSTVRRWIGSGVPMPASADAFLAMMCERQATRGALVYARQRIGLPLATIAAGSETVVPSITRLLGVPGVADPKRMPAIVAEDRDGTIGLRLTGSREDEISVRGASFVLTRHPDPWHLDGYMRCAGARGHQPVTAQHVDHHYSLIAHSLEDAAELVHQISTHKGVVRTVWSDPMNPSLAIRDDLEDIIPGTPLQTMVPPRSVSS